MRSLMMSLLVAVSLLGLAGCGSSSSESNAMKVRMLTPEELSEVDSVQNSVQAEERAHRAELRKGIRPSR
jgi:hypothetical protein